MEGPALLCAGATLGTLSVQCVTNRLQRGKRISHLGALGTREPLRGQLRIALHSGVSKDQIVDLFIHLEAYAGAARAFDSYQAALEVFAETAEGDAGTSTHGSPAGS
jgi:hypothetical protein